MKTTLLLITKDETKHYVLIKDFNKFMFTQTKHEHRKHFCMHCLQFFSSERVLNNHKDNSIQVNGTQAVKMPTKDNNILKFNKGVSTKGVSSKEFPGGERPWDGAHSHFRGVSGVKIVNHFHT